MGYKKQICPQVDKFKITTPSKAAICKECNRRMFCGREGVISRSEVFA